MATGEFKAPGHLFGQQISGEHALGCICSTCIQRRYAEQFQNQVNQGLYHLYTTYSGSNSAGGLGYNSIEAERDAVKAELAKLKKECEPLKASLFALVNMGLIVRDPNGSGMWKSNLESVIKERDNLRQQLNFAISEISKLTVDLENLKKQHGIGYYGIAKSYAAKISLARSKEDRWEVDDWDLLPDAD